MGFTDMIVWCVALMCLTVIIGLGILAWIFSMMPKE